MNAARRTRAENVRTVATGNNVSRRVDVLPFGRGHGCFMLQEVIQTMTAAAPWCRPLLEAVEKPVMQIQMREDANCFMHQPIQYLPNDANLTIVPSRLWTERWLHVCALAQVRCGAGTTLPMLQDHSSSGIMTQAFDFALVNSRLMLQPGAAQHSLGVASTLT